MNILEEIKQERERQDSKWGGPSHDDKLTIAEWVQIIQDYAGWARTMAGQNSLVKARRRLKQVAALAVAAVEAIDRTLAATEGHTCENGFHDWQKNHPVYQDVAICSKCGEESGK